MYFKGTPILTSDLKSRQILRSRKDSAPSLLTNNQNIDLSINNKDQAQEVNTDNLPNDDELFVNCINGITNELSNLEPQQLSNNLNGDNLKYDTIMNHPYSQTGFITVVPSSPKNINSPIKIASFQPQIKVNFSNGIPSHYSRSKSVDLNTSETENTNSSTVNYRPLPQVPTKPRTIITLPHLMSRQRQNSNQTTTPTTNNQITNISTPPSTKIIIREKIDATSQSPLIQPSSLMPSASSSPASSTISSTSSSSSSSTSNQAPVTPMQISILKQQQSESINFRTSPPSPQYSRGINIIKI